MGFKDRLNSFADLLHFKSDPYEARDTQMYDEQYDYDDSYDDQGYQEEYDYEEPEEQSTFEPTYGSAGSYSAAGARPAQRPKNKSSVRGFLDKVRGTTPAPNARQEPAPRVPQSYQPNNVIQMNHAGQGSESPAPRMQERYTEPYDTQEYADRPARNVTRSSTMIVTVRRLEDSEEIISHMLEGGSVIINMEEIDEPLKKRMIDIISGAAFALEATIKRISYRNYYVAGSGEEIITGSSLREPEPYEEDGGGYYGGRDRRY